MLNIYVGLEDLIGWRRFAPGLASRSAARESPQAVAFEMVLGQAPHAVQTKCCVESTCCRVCIQGGSLLARRALAQLTCEHSLARLDLP